MLRSKALAASSSANTESIAGRRPAAVEQRRDLRELRAVGLDDEVHAGDTARLRRLLGHRDEPATLAHHARGAGEPLAARGVEDEVEGFDARVPRPGRVVDDDVGAELPCALHAARRRRRGHVGAVAGGQRRGELADTAGGPVDEHPLARGEPAVLEQPLPGAERRERHGRRLDVAERTRLGREQLGRDRGVVGGDPVAVKRGHSVNLVTDGQAVDAGPEGDDDAGQLVGGDRRKPVDGPLELVARERRSVDTNERLSVARRRCRDLLEDQLLGPAGGSQHDRSHRRRSHPVYAIGAMCRSLRGCSGPTLTGSVQPDTTFVLLQTDTRSYRYLNLAEDPAVQVPGGPDRERTRRCRALRAGPRTSTAVARPPLRCRAPRSSGARPSCPSTAAGP